MVRLNPDRYRTRHVSEVDEPIHNDCLVAAGLMWEAALTLGEVLLDADYTPLTNPEIRKRREAMRNLLSPGKQSGPLSLADLRTMTDVYFPDLPQVPFYDSAGEIRTEGDVITELRNGAVGLSLGNPANVTNKASKLRQWTRGDNYDHWIYLDRANAGSVYVYNPLVPYGSYDGEWVTIPEWRQYAATMPGTDTVKTIVAPRGAWSAANRATAEIRKRLTTARARIKELEAGAPPDCAEPIADATAALTAQVNDLQDAIDTRDAAMAVAADALAPFTQEA